MLLSDELTRRTAEYRTLLDTPGLTKQEQVSRALAELNRLAYHRNGYGDVDVSHVDSFLQPHRELGEQWVHLMNLGDLQLIAVVRPALNDHVDVLLHPVVHDRDATERYYVGTPLTANNLDGLIDALARHAATLASYGT